MYTKRLPIQERHDGDHDIVLHFNFYVIQNNAGSRLYHWFSYLPENTSSQCSHNSSLDFPDLSTECPQHFLPTQVPCLGEDEDQVWVWEQFEMSSTGVTEWSLVCRDQWKVGLASSLYMVGLLLGSALVGLTSDRFGRRPVLLAMIITSILTTVSGAFCRGYWSYVTTRLLAGVAAQVCFYTTV